jgi:integrase
VLNQDEAERVLRQSQVEKSLGVRDRALLEVLYSTGIRRMEVLKLRLYDVDKNHGLESLGDDLNDLGIKIWNWLNNDPRQNWPSIYGPKPVPVPIPIPVPVPVPVVP